MHCIQTNSLYFVDVQAYGALFKWDVLFEGTRELLHASWAEVAEKNEFEVPDEDDTDRTLGKRPEIAITQVRIYISLYLYTYIHCSVTLSPELNKIIEYYRFGDSR